MEWDDIIYLSLLVGSIGFGSVLRIITCPQMRKNIATAVGIAIIYVVSGKHSLHPLFFTTINALIIKCLDKKIIHKISFGFSFAYLIFFRTTIHFGIPYPPAHTNLVQMIMAFKMIGLAFEVHDSSKAKTQLKTGVAVENEQRFIETPSFLDIYQYSFCYLGVLTGPYYTYRMYCDLFETPFWKYVNCESVTLERAKYLLFYAIVYLLATHYFPFSYIESSDFYTVRGVLYRLWYIYPLFVQFRMRMYIGMRLSECVLTMAGMGAYPEVCEPIPTKGPTKNLSEIKSLCEDEERAKHAKYNLVSGYNIEPYNTEFDYTVRSSMKAWNISVQYWLATYVYLRFPIKAYRMLVTFVISALWHGVYAGYYLTICSVPFYLPIEDIYRRNLRNVKWPPVVSTVCWLIGNQWRLYLMSYWAVTFRLLTLSASLKYWMSIYFIPTLITLLMYAVSFLIFKKPRRLRQEEQLSQGQANVKQD